MLHGRLFYKHMKFVIFLLPPAIKKKVTKLCQIKKNKSYPAFKRKNLELG